MLFFFTFDGSAQSNIGLKTTGFKSQREKSDNVKLIEKENNRQFLAGAIKLCRGADYIEESLGTIEMITENGNRRNNSDTPSCFTIIMPNLRDPYETYMFTINGNDQFILNSSNPFKIKQIRESSTYLKEVQRIKDEAAGMDTENLLFFSMGAVASNYDFSSGKLKVSFSPYFSILGGSLSAENRPPSSVEISVPEAEAEKLFSYYEKNKPTKGNGYKKSFFRAYNSINAIVTYKIEYGRYSNFDIKPKKVEFFNYTGWKNKLGEYFYD